MHDEAERLRADLLSSVRQMRRSETARVTEVSAWSVADARTRIGATREEFARLLGVSTRTLADWEAGRRAPTGAAQTLIRVALRNPEALRDLRP